MTIGTIWNAVTSTGSPVGTLNGPTSDEMFVIVVVSGILLFVAIGLAASIGKMRAPSPSINTLPASTEPKKEVV